MCMSNMKTDTDIYKIDRQIDSSTKIDSTSIIFNLLWVIITIFISHLFIVL